MGSGYLLRSSFLPGSISDVGTLFFLSGFELIDAFFKPHNLSHDDNTSRFCIFCDGCSLNVGIRLTPFNLPTFSGSDKIC